MRQALDKTLRKQLEDTVVKARDIVEVAVFEALQRLGVAEAQAPSYLSEEERSLRNKLRAHARQLGDKLEGGKQETERLINEMAYEHWHRMLFARYLEQNNLLMYDEYTPVTLDECFELAEEEPNCKDGWELAGRLAQKMLPQIFRVDSPVFDIKLSMNRVEELENLIAQLDSKTYQAQDSLGWCYQFWQNKKKKQVNDAGVKIGAQELSPVTQLFTEPYMVSFLLDNALGAWWTNKRLTQDDLIRANNEQELRQLASIPGVPLEYLRFSKEESADSESKAAQWKLAAGGFEKWPEHLSDFKTLDPCCGSGHFLVAVFLMLVPMRMQLEGLSEKEAVDAVLRDNVHGLEVDQRCVELAAFALTLEAWRYPNTGGYRELPELKLVCCGLSISEAHKECKDLAKGDAVLTDAISLMERTFRNAPTLGSLISPTRTLTTEVDLPLNTLQSKILTSSKLSNKSNLIITELIKLASILTEKFSWVITNVPYLGRGKMDQVMGDYVDQYYPHSSSDLATSLIDRSFELSNGCVSIVSSQNWMFLGTFEKFRKEFLESGMISMVARLGYKSFTTQMYDFPVVLFSTLMQQSNEKQQYYSCDAENKDKENQLINGSLSLYSQHAHLESPKSRISFGLQNSDSLLPVKSTEGLSTGDSARYLREFWEVDTLGKNYILYQTSPSKPAAYDGMRKIMFWESGQGSLSKSSAARIQGLSAWGKPGILVGRVGDIRGTKYFGGAFDKSAVVLSGRDSNVNMDEVYQYVVSEEFEKQVRSIDKKLGVATSVFESIPFISTQDTPSTTTLQRVECTDETQWLYSGNVLLASNVLQVAVARLLGYQWPAELDPEMELAPEMCEVMKKNADFADLIDDDGIVCIPAVRGEKTAAKRLESILHKAYGDEWTNTVEANLLKVVKGKDLESWLRDKFFDQHSKLFQHRPFIWQVWDGLKDGFSALVNYHKLDYKGLERLIYTYLDDWISTQKRDVADSKDGADIRLTAAENLKKQLEAILAGEKGLDIFVRWKPLEEQPIGWNPDLNDGVRLNIRPFMLAKDVGKKGAGVLRGKPNIHWKKDRGTDVASAPWFDLGPVYGEKEGSRINEHYLTLAEKQKAREEAQ